MAFSPLITRIYGPEALGLLGTYMAMVAVVVPLAALAYPIAIVLPRDDSDAVGLLRLSALLSFTLALLVTAALWMGGGRLTEMIGVESVADYLLLIPLAMLFSAWVQIAQQWLVRKEEFGVIARSSVVLSLIMNGAKAGFGWFHPVAAVLIVLTTLGYAFHAALLFFGALRRYEIVPSDQDEVAPRSIAKVALRYRDFPLYRAPQDFINAVSQSLPVLMLAAFFGPAAAGFYSVGKMVIGIPSVLLGKAVYDVFYPRITEVAHDGGNIARHIGHATGLLLMIGIVPFGLVILLGPRLFGVVFGEEWVSAGEYAQWLALFFLFNFINKPSVAAVPVLGIQRGLLVYELFSTGGKLLGLVVGFYWLQSDLWAVALFSIIGALAYTIMIFWIIFHALRWR